MKIFQVDSFSDQPFRGNPAGVCILETPAEPAWMQAVACEMNLSETAFLVRTGDGYNLRWFTPLVEVKLCGHATLASAHILWEQGCHSPVADILFNTLSGQLTAHKNGEWIALNFPAQPAVSAEIPTGLLDALGVSQLPRFVGKNKSDFLIELENEQQVKDLAPDFGRLKFIPDLRGVIVTSRASTTGIDFISRFFAPAVGVNEDPVTGSAHTALTPYWSTKLGKKELTGYQASARGGMLHLTNLGERVLIEGQAVTVLIADLIY